MRVGIGHDTHRLEAGRPLILGGIRIEHERGLAGHSDADVVLHALTDALLGAAGMGDIGDSYPNTDPAYRDADSAIFVREYVRRIVEWRVDEAKLSDATLAAELTEKYTSHFLEVVEHIDRRVRALFDEPVAEGEDLKAFVYARLKLRCLEIFRTFDEDNQRQLFASVKELVAADGVAHPAEAKFCSELETLAVQLGRR